MRYINITWLLYNVEVFILLYVQQYHRIFLLNFVVLSERYNVYPPLELISSSPVNRISAEYHIYFMVEDRDIHNFT